MSIPVDPGWYSGNPSKGSIPWAAMPITLAGATAPLVLKIDKVRWTK